MTLDKYYSMTEEQVSELTPKECNHIQRLIDEEENAGWCIYGDCE